MLAKLVMFIFFITHFWFIRGLKKAQDAVEAITKESKQAAPAQVVVAPVQVQPVYSAINVTDSSIISEELDK